MSFFDIINQDPQTIVDFFKRLGIIIPLWVVEWGISIIAVILLLLLVGSVVNWVVKNVDEILTWLNKNRRWRNNYIKKGLEHSFGDYLQTDKQKCYIPTQSQGVPPHNYDEPDEAVSATPQEDLVKFFLTKVFVSWNTNRLLYCILAGSGMGKTTFAVQLFVEYIKKYKSSTLPYQIYIKDMGESKVLDEVNALASNIGEEAHHSILILDALDENLHASDNFESFKESLESAIAPFKFVVITCRSQFFPNEQAIPTQSGIRRNSSEKNLLNYNKVYICPFSPDDINLYIKKKYPGRRKKNRKMREQAQAIIEKCRHLMARPVLLSYIDDLLGDEKEYTSETEIYETLIDKWLNREVNTISEEETKEARHKELLSFSEKLAVTIYLNWKDTGDFRLDAIQMDDFCKKNGFESNKYQFRRRSLINHDALGSYKFSHKSFLEYFLARHYFENPDFDFSFEGMDMAELFYQGFCKREYKEYRNRNICKIEKLGDFPYFPTEEYTLVIAKKSTLDYNHMFNVIEPSSFSELELNWNAYNEKVQEFIENSGVRSITISHYQKGVGSLKQILKASELESVAITGTALPSSFIKEAEKRGVHVFLNDETVVRGLASSRNSTISLQLQLQYERRLQLLRTQKLELTRLRIDQLLRGERNDREELR